MRGRFIPILLVLACLLVACGAPPATPTFVVIGTATREPTITPIPTSTDEPATLPPRQAQAEADRATLVAGVLATQTALAPTAPPAPTARPRPTATAAAFVPDVTTAELTYIGTVSQQATDLAAALDQWSLDSQTGVMFSQDWIVRVAVDSAVIQHIADRALAVPAPPRLQDTDAAYKAGMRHYRRAMTLLAQGVDARSETILGQSAAEMTAGNTEIHRASGLLQAFVQAHAVP